MDQDEDKTLIDALIAAGDITESDGNLWDLPLPTFKVLGKSATEQLIEERDYLEGEFKSV
jgi:hypothetical protein